MEWRYKMCINGVFWKGYSDHPTGQQLDIETRSFKQSEYYDGGEVEVVIRKGVVLR